jgi:ATP/maltotriose-dependent transcriptional regulator MalT
MSVLEYMAQGMTNGQISRNLTFSESTIRHETMAIYRFLRVAGRREAVAHARELGILTH